MVASVTIAAAYTLILQREFVGLANHSPPSTTMMEPVIHEPAGEARKATIFAMSAGLPQRWSGIILRAYDSMAFSTANTSGTPWADGGGVKAFRTPSVGIGP